MRILNQNEEVKNIFDKSKILIWTIILSFILIIGRVAYLQLYRGDEFYRKSKNNFILSEKIIPSRGDIISADNKKLATTMPAFKISIVPIFFSDRSQIYEQLTRLSTLLALSSQQQQRVEKYLKSCYGRCRYIPYIVKDEIKKTEILNLASSLSHIPGIIISSSYRRVYPLGEKAAHVTGYVSKITKKELETSPGFDSESFTGKTGLEKNYEKFLHGTYGETYHVIDYMGRKIEVPRSVEKELPPFRPALKGSELHVTVRSYLQNEAQKAIGEHSGAIVLMEIKTGNILALYSSPSYNPNLLARKHIPSRIWNAYSHSILHPLVNKAIRESYFPGSVFKIIPAMAGLYHNIITPKSTYKCLGCLVFGRETKCCWNRGGHGYVNLRKSLKESCDIFYYFLSQEIGFQRLGEFAKLFNVGRITGIDIPNEEDGILPTQEWYLRNYPGQPLYKGYIMNTSIGQGDLRMTPLQIAVLYAGMANNGIIMKPKIADYIIHPDGKKEVIPQEVLRILSIDEEKVFKPVMKALWSVTNEPGGTAYRYIDSTIPQAAGKTGTSQVISNYLRSKIDVTQEERRTMTEDDALFAAIFPYANPEVVVITVLEHAGHGGSDAAPVAYRMLKAYYQKSGIED